jgi:hypothetical protein
MGLIRIGTDRVQLLYRNAKQMKKIVEAKYTGLRFDENVLGAKELGFECSISAVGRGDDYAYEECANCSSGFDRQSVACMQMASSHEDYGEPPEACGEPV